MQTFNELVQKILAILPDAGFDEDLEGQIVIYTSKQEGPNGSLLDFQFPEE